MRCTHKYVVSLANARLVRRPEGFSNQVFTVVPWLSRSINGDEASLQRIKDVSSGRVLLPCRAIDEGRFSNVAEEFIAGAVELHGVVVHQE